MPHTAVSMAPNGPGILAMRHRGFDDDTPPWDIDKRAALLGFEITGRDDSDGANSIGHWKEDPDTRGDLNLANYWQADYQKRPVGCWSWWYGTVISKAAKHKAQTNTTGGQGDVTQTSSDSDKAEILPIGKEGDLDKRFKPKKPMILQPEGRVGGNGGNGNGGDGQDPGTVNLGGGWVYTNGVLLYNGPSGGGGGAPIGFGSGFAGFGGVPNLAGGGSGFAGFGGVPNLVGGGSGFPGFGYSSGR